MTGPVLVAAVSVGYLLLLFAIAYGVDRQPEHGRRLIDSSVVYTLSLAVYCTSWTFYGSVGRAAQTGIDFLTIYLGPTLAFALGWLLLSKILRIAKANRITSIADFIASRFGKSAGVAGLVTVIAVISVVPYLALQIKAVSTSFTLLTSYPAAAAPLVPAPILQDAGLWATMLLTLFAMLFGSRSIHPGEHHQGMVAAVAFESLVKLLSLSAVGLFVGLALFHGFGDLFARAAADHGIRALSRYEGGARHADWIAFILLSFAATVCLPRQFQVMVVENVDERHLDRALWLFPLYLLAINLFVLPIAVAGRLLLPAGIDPDSFVLTLPLASGQNWLALAVFIGGFSASAGMIIVSAAALSTMVCNDLVMPILLRFRPRAPAAGSDMALLLSIRRAAMAVVMALGYLYNRHVGGDYPLVSIGLVSFAGVAQFFPAIVLGLFWRRATKAGAVAGILAGFLVWGYTLALPSFVRSGSLPETFIASGPFGMAFLKPYALFGLSGLSPVAHSAFWSLLVNVALLVGCSLFVRQSAVERAQAALFVDVFESAQAAQLWRRTAQLPDLVTVVGRFLGHQRAHEMFAAWAQRRGLSAAAFEADAEMVLYAERLLAGVIGTASARVLVSSVVEEEPLGIDEVMLILNEASRVIEINRRLEEKSHALEAAGEELRRANEQLQELDRLKDDFISTVNHELRTPLTSIRSFSEILIDNPEIEPARRDEFQRIILRETERLTRLINQMLDLAKIESGQVVYELTAVALEGVLRDAAAATGQLFRDKGVTLEIAAPEPDLRVLADRDLLIQVLLNLLSNAVKYCPAGRGRVRAAIESAGDAVLVAIADNGPGIDPAERETVFERFRQGRDTLTGKPAGTGLGLAICRTILRRLGGEIWIEGAPGAGAILKLRLARAPSTAMAGGTVA